MTKENSGNGTTLFKETEKKLTLKEMQGAVGGYIQVAFDNGKTQIICNEEGKLANLPINVTATKIWEEKLREQYKNPSFALIHDVLVGDVLICEGKALLS